MVSPEALTHTRGQIREAATDPCAWSVALESVAEMTGADGAWLARETDRTPDAPRTSALDGLLEDYFERGWYKHDENVAHCVPRFRMGQTVVSDSDISHEVAQRRSAFHHDFALRHDFPHFMATSFHADTTLWGLSCLRHAKGGFFDVAQTKVIAALRSDLTNAATISSLLGSNTMIAMGRALDLSDRPAIAINGHGAVVYVNDRFERERESFGEDLRITRDGLVTARDRRSNAALSAIIASASGLRGVRQDVQTIAVARREGMPILAKAVPISAIGSNPFMDAKLFLFFPAKEPVEALDAVRIRDAFAVTLAEARLLLRLRMGDSVTTAAETLGIKRQTARTQLKSVFVKLNVHSQRDLLELLRQV